MSDTNNPAPITPPTPPAGTDPTKNPDNGGKGFDTKSISDEDFAKFYDDERAFNHPRFKKLGEKARLADEYERKANEAENKKLEEEKKYSELAEKRKAEAEKYKNDYQTSVLDNKLTREAAKLGFVDLDDALKLVDRSKVKLTDDGQVEGAEEAMKALATAKPHLVTAERAKSLGTSTNPGNAQVPGKHKMSDIRNTEYYRKNEASIKQALKTPGAIIYD